MLMSADTGAVALLAVAAAFVVAGFVKGVVGLGLPTVSMGLVGIFLPPAQAAVLLLLPSLVTNVWQMLGGPSLRGSVRRLWTLQLGVLLGTVFAPIGLAGLNPKWAALGLGTALLIYALSGILALRIATPERWQPWASPLVGLLTGAVTAATGVFVFPAVPYIQGLGMRKEALVQALGLSFFVSTLALWLRLTVDGAMPALGPALAASALAPLAGALIGMAAGQWLRGRLSEILFKRVFFIGMGAVALHLLVRGVMR